MVMRKNKAIADSHLSMGPASSKNGVLGAPRAQGAKRRVLVSPMSQPLQASPQRSLSASLLHNRCLPWCVGNGSIAPQFEPTTVPIDPHLTEEEPGALPCAVIFPRQVCFDEEAPGFGAQWAQLVGSRAGAFRPDKVSPHPRPLPVLVSSAL